VSLIFSALSEMEKQAQEAQPARAPMAGMQAYGPDRKQWPIMIGTLGALGLGAFIAVKLLSPTVAVEAPVTQPATDIVSQPVAAATGSSITTLPNAQSNATPALAPYMQAAPAQGAYDSNLMPITNLGSPVVADNTAASTAAPVYPSMQSAATPDAGMAPAAGDIDPAAAASAIVAASQNAASQNDAAIAVAEPPPVPQAAPAPRTPPDKSYLDKSTFKLGRQADSSKDQDVSHWVNLFSNEMSAGNFEQARAYLSKLQAKLPAQSITLLRMQAWYAVDTSDDNTAREIFLRILDRVPDDQNAGVNIALIDWRANRYSTALARIDRLHQLYPDSSLVSQNWRSMHDQQQ
jgi:tetratricopeptide (TPR) repeat protein